MKYYTGKKVPMIELKLDEVVACLEDYLALAKSMPFPGTFEGEAKRALGELRKVIAYRGNQLVIMERVKRHKGDHLSILRVDRARRSQKGLTDEKKKELKKRG